MNQMVSSLPHDTTHPSRIAEPNGLVSDSPPKKTFQMVSAKVSASEFEENPIVESAPPRLMVTRIPLSWQLEIAPDSPLQSNRFVPGKVAF
jgi:hypothetical protein